MLNILTDTDNVNLSLALVVLEHIECLQSCLNTLTDNLTYKVILNSVNKNGAILFQICLLEINGVGFISQCHKSNCKFAKYFIPPNKVCNVL
jgi:hypothetical protein